MKDPRVSIDDLRTFVAVAQDEHVTSAAGRLHLSQPAVSRAVARLEDQFGVKLFDRPGHRVRLNAFGRALLGHAQRIVAQFEAARGEIVALRDPHAGPVRIGFLHSLGTWLVPDLIRAFRAVEPNVEFVLRQATSDAVAQMLLDGEVDVVLASARPPLDEPVGWHELLRERLALAVPPEHRFAGRRRMRLAEAAAEPFVTVSPSSEFRQITDRLCRQAGFAPTIAFESDELSTARALVAAGLGVAIVPVTPVTAVTPVGAAGAVAPAAPVVAGTSVALSDTGAGRPLGLAWMTHRQLPGPAEAFRTWLIGYTATEPWRTNG